MNQALLLLQKLCQVMAVFLIGILFFATVGFGWQGEAMAKPLTPEARSYQSPPVDNKTIDHQAPEPETNLIENTQENLQGTAKTVREKLNLDEPLPPSTKKFIRSVQDKLGGKEGIKNADGTD